jgi:hypothetical protein
MYRNRTKGSQRFNARMQRWRDAKEQIRLNGPIPYYGPNLPDIRRRVIIEDYDCGHVIRHEFVLLKSDRIDCYRVAVDGKLLPGRIGWARVMELARKAFIRVANYRC